MITDRNKYTMPKGNMRGKPGENWMDYGGCGWIVGNGRFEGEEGCVGRLGILRPD